MDLLLSFSDFNHFKEMMIFERAHFVATTPKPKSSKATALGLANSLNELNLINSIIRKHWRSMDCQVDD
jgi:hypothetical protein